MSLTLLLTAMSWHLMSAMASDGGACSSTAAEATLFQHDASAATDMAAFRALVDDDMVAYADRFRGLSSLTRSSCSR
mgnify:CR=1 FL=1